MVIYTPVSIGHFPEFAIAARVKLLVGIDGCGK